MRILVAKVTAQKMLTQILMDKISTKILTQSSQRGLHTAPGQARGCQGERGLLDCLALSPMLPPHSQLCYLNAAHFSHMRAGQAVVPTP